ncbi:ABC transporter permease [Cryobacterium sp. PH29-G1]|uniref:ABC transporter permease n=1 Tax=Cryobacterium sp. PH29-G1 TaxID=3046211 RepID=UPI0024B954FF|nr:ABC transporter permease [Cryobacterium sp. PH29-G1]MDJ0349592.1 ABC transporter permease [Cryobacterium sp. PH29-G1]
MSKLTSQTAPAEPANPVGRVGSRPLGRIYENTRVYIGIGTMLVLLVVYLSVTQPTFATAQNLITILETNSVLLLVAVGLTFVLLTGGFDLSVGGMLALSGILLAKLIESGVNYYFAAILVIVAAAILGGVLNGLLIGKLGLSFFVVTLGTMSLFRGAGQVVTEGHGLSLYDVEASRLIGSGRFLGIPWLVIIALTVLLLAIFVTRYTGFGRMLYAVGGNAEAARLSGIKVWLVRAVAYGICAGLSGLAGILESSRLASASPTAATGLELIAAAAVLLGGTSFAGGAGSMIGTLLGALFLGIISNGMTISQISSFWQSVVTGFVLLAAVLLDWFRMRRDKRMAGV